MAIQAFSPSGGTVSIGASTTTARGTLLGTGNIARLYNACAVPAFIAFGDSDVEATTAGTILAPYSVETFAIGVEATHMAVILESDTGTVYVQRGDGG